MALVVAMSVRARRDTCVMEQRVAFPVATVTSRANFGVLAPRGVSVRTRGPDALRPAHREPHGLAVELRRLRQ